MKKLLLAVSVLAALTGPVWARTVEEQVLAGLEGQGYVILEYGYTFLGRLRIVAENGLYHREIVVNPGTGEILRDYAVTLPQSVARANPHAAGGKQAGTGSVAAVDPANAVTVSPGSSRVDDNGVGTMSLGDPDQPTVDMVMPESILQMELGAP